jgi:hypothetical protein
MDSYGSNIEDVGRQWSDSNGAHFNDIGKLPSHPTFSTESAYSKPGSVGGVWTDRGNDKWDFAPSATNLRHNTVENIREYLRNSDPNVNLVLGKGR